MGMQRNTIHYFVILIALAIFTGCAPHSVKNDNILNQIPKEPTADINASSVLPTPLVVEKVPENKKNPSNKTTSKKDLSKKTDKNSITTEPELEINIDELNQKVKTYKTREVREILNANPKAFEMIKESDNKLYYVGPSGWRVIDIIEGLRNKRLNQKEIINHIQAAKLPYKMFTYHEIQVLLKNKIPFRVINTMMTVSK
jgi:hypothetical protein